MQVFGAANCNIMVPRAIYVTALKRPGVAALHSLAARRPPPTASAFAGTNREQCRSRLVEVREIGEAVPSLVRAGRPRSQV